jgi:acyl-CoA synthetase (AMP-forming)/AMP-acid ligase II
MRLVAPEADQLTIVEGLVRSVLNRPRAMTFFPGQNLGIEISELEELSARRAAFFLDHGIQPGDTVGLLHPVGIGLLVDLFAGLRAGATVTVLPVQPDRPSDGDTARILGLAQAASVRYLVAGPPFNGLAVRLCAANLGITLIGAGMALARTTLPAIQPGQRAIVQFTAGRTGPPKAVLLTHGAVMAGIQAFRSAIALNHQDVLVHWRPPDDPVGLFGLLGQVVSGARSFVFTPAALRTHPWHVLRCIGRRYDAVTIGRNSCYETLCDALSTVATELDLSRWRVAVIGGEPVQPATVERFTRLFGQVGVQPTVPHPVYQLAEATLAVSSKLVDTVPTTVTVNRRLLAETGRVRLARPGSDDAVSYVSVGWPVAGVDIRIVDPRTRSPLVRSSLVDGSCGHIQVSGASVAVSYRRDLPRTIGAFDGKWLHTGDQGFLWQGQLYVAADR